MVIQWFPGHMAKTERLIRENTKLVDVVIELLDARIPASSRNPRLDELSGGLPRVSVLTKEDLADPAVTEMWLAPQGGSNLVKANLKSGEGLKLLQRKVAEAGRTRLEKLRAKGRLGRPLRAMVVGIPNVGKSTLINRLAGGSPARVGNRPGVTRGKQWIKAGGFELLDTPGVLWPSFENQATGVKLAITGAIRDEIFDVEAVCLCFLDYLPRFYRHLLEERYGVTATEPAGLLAEIGRKRGCLVAGGEVDTEKASRLILTDFRTGRLGKVSLERPGEDDGVWTIKQGGEG